MPGVAGDELGAEVVFELGYLGAEDAGAGAQLAGCLGKAWVLDDGEESADSVVAAAALEGSPDRGRDVGGRADVVEGVAVTGASAPGGDAEVVGVSREGVGADVDLA